MNLTNQWVNSSTYVWKPSNGSFVTAYASANTITVSSLPDDVSALTTTDILWVVQYNSEWQLVREFHRTKHEISVSGSTITVQKPTPEELNLRPFESWDTFVVYTNIPNVSWGGWSSSWASVASAEYSSPSDFSATYTSATTLTLSSLPISLTSSSQISFIKVIPVSGDAYILTNGSGWVTMRASSNVITVEGAATTFASWDVYEVGLNAQEKAYDASTNTQMNSIMNPDYAHVTDTEHFIDATNVDTTTVRVIVNMDTYPNPYFGFICSGWVTMTIFREVSPDADDTADTGWERDTDLQPADLVDGQGSYAVTEKVNVKRYMVKYVTTDATNAIDGWVTKG